MSHMPGCRYGDPEVQEDGLHTIWRYLVLHPLTFDSFKFIAKNPVPHYFVIVGSGVCHRHADLLTEKSPLPEPTPRPPDLHMARPMSNIPAADVWIQDGWAKRMSGAEDPSGDQVFAILFWSDRRPQG